MRKEFFKYLYELMQKNKSIIVLTGDLGYGGFDQIRDEFPDRFVNCGAAEQAMMDIAVGLALEGKIPVVYSITPFLLYRPYETLRTYINFEKIPVIMVGSGRDDDYKHDGFSHYAGDDWKLFTDFGTGDSAILENINAEWPVDNKTMRWCLKDAIKAKVPYYINLVR